MDALRASVRKFRLLAVAAAIGLAIFTVSCTRSHGDAGIGVAVPAPPPFGASEYSAPKTGQDAAPAAKFKAGVPAPAERAQSVAAVATPGARGAGLPGRIPGRDIAYSGRVSLLVDDVGRALGTIESMAVNVSGDVASLEDTRPSAPGETRAATIRIEVPTARFDGVLRHVSGIGGVVSTNVTAEDVSDQLVDDRARLRNLRRTEHDMLAIMDRSGRIEEVLDVENQLSTVRDQIEHIDAERTALERRVAYSSLEISLTEPARASVATPSTVARLHNAWTGALARLTDFSVALASAAIAIVVFAPYWLAAILGATAIAAISRRRRERSV